MGVIGAGCMMYAGLINANSAANKSAEIQEYIFQNNLNLLAITETWARPGRDGDYALRACCPPGFHFEHEPRVGRGGGVAVIYKMSSVPVVKNRLLARNFTFESIDVQLRHQGIRLIVIYRPPSGSVPDFLRDFGCLLRTAVRQSQRHLLIVGDFNIHVCTARNASTLQFLDLIEQFGLKQHVYNATHKSGHVLDLVISYSHDTLVSNVAVQHFYLGRGDHKPVKFTLKLSSSRINVTTNPNGIITPVLLNPSSRLYQRPTRISPSTEEEPISVTMRTYNERDSYLNTTKKFRDFVSGPIGDKPVTSLPGIGRENGERLMSYGFYKVLYVHRNRIKFRLPFLHTSGQNM